MIHRLKINTEYYQAIERGDKRFELRKDDRGFQVGDYVLLLEIDDDGLHTGRELPIIEIQYIFHGGKYGLEDGYCIFNW